MTELLTAFFSDRFNVLVSALLGLLAFGVYLAFFAEVKEESRKK